MRLFRKKKIRKKETNDQKDIKKAIINEPKISIDPISNEIDIDWIQVAGLKKEANQSLLEIGIIDRIIDGLTTGGNDDNFSKIIISPIYQNGAAYLKIKIQWNNFRAKRGASFTFKFENNELLQFILPKNPSQIMKHIDWGRFDEIKIPITKSQLSLFATQNLTFWRYKNGETVIDLKESIVNNTKGELNNFQNNVQSLFKDFLSIIELKGLTIESKTAIDTTSPCGVYLMKDNSNNAIKIGIANDPKLREKTLQSEKPSIELIEFKLYPNRHIATTIEKVLHETYNNKRVRGEWFTLNQTDISDIKCILNI